METPSEWAKRFNSPKSGDQSAPSNPEGATVGNPTLESEFPREPFQCPACGQLLAPACRVCVACKHVIDPADIVRTQQTATPVPRAAEAEPRLEPVRFSWTILFAVIAVTGVLVLALQSLLKDQQQILLVMAGVETFAGIWVFFDALQRRIPRPLRWAAGTMLLPLVIFPWYLTRRRAPQSPVPFLEAGSVTRLILLALLYILLVNLIFYIVQGPQPFLAPPATPKIEKPNEGSPARVTRLQLWNAGHQPGRILPAAPMNVHFDSSTPSEARQT